MVIARARTLLLAALLLAAPPVSSASDRSAAEADLRSSAGADARSDAATGEEADPDGSAPATIVYVPPQLGAPRSAVGGGIRGGTVALPRPVVLAPDHVAQTERDAPSVFWYLDRSLPADIQVSFLLVREDQIDPVAEHALQGASAAGIHRVRLSELGVTLEPDIEYEWSITIVVDPNERDRDLVSTGWLRRVDASKRSADELDARAYASRSLWYDALEAISDALDARPEDSTLRAQRDALLAQADLP